MALDNAPTPNRETKDTEKYKDENKNSAPHLEEGNAMEKANERQKNLYEERIADFHRLGWKRLTILLIVEAVALGSLSIPSAFASLGMVAGVICSVGLGIIAIYTSYIIGEVKLAYPHISNYADAGRLIGDRYGCGRLIYAIISTMIILQLIFLVGSHCLTGTIAFMAITKSDICSVVFGVVSAIILLLLAIPPTFADIAILGYIDFASILLAIGITMIGSGRDAATSPGGLAGVNWSAWPKENLTFAEAFVALSNIIFAYSFAMVQFSFMDEMHTPADYKKSILALGVAEIVIYTLTGALIYAFVGQDVASPALSSLGNVLSRVAFGIALPVIFISGSINIVIFGRQVHGTIFANSPIRLVASRAGWLTWLATISVGTVIAFVIAEVIPFFNDLLSISSALFISGFTYYFPAIMWFLLLRKKGESRWSLAQIILNIAIFLMGLVILAGGIYSSVNDIVRVTVHNFWNSLLIRIEQITKYNTGSIRSPFTCATPS
ncbi:Amino acid transporter transmembrane [Penicillium macrosclerotiorum]|uniref:Amino acid transporter transmembrane n=1 Tax=Penicillium macrosclerotiorum TaxID=303699 RepID=UPI0025472319|nr:Amino acid transporter transmembrane [Penicillium macrosclerotiorum]KAJ5682505.1 Amino acid transporter transmembrane [Penicillium macrosclerotiorum]